MGATIHSTNNTPDLFGGLLKKVMPCHPGHLLLIVVLASCRPQLPPSIDFEQTPVQILHNLSVLQTDNSQASMRMTSPLMRRYNYVKDSVEQSYELYTAGFCVKAYTPEGELETTITAAEARHNLQKNAESWCAYGDVHIVNHIKGEEMATDTLWWDRAQQKIYTDCYVRMTSYSGLMQGYGMTSDERARNTVILHPFDAWSLQRDSTDLYVDTINIIGP